VVVILCVAVSAPVLNSYVLIDRSRLIVKDIFSMSERTYKYSEIAELHQRGDLSVDKKSSVSYSIVFGDGYTWNSMLLFPLYESNDEMAIQALALLIRKKIILD
jgi:hypothetical protein